MSEPTKMNAIREAIGYLRAARKHHNDECGFCAVKDTATDKALALLEQPQPGPGEFEEQEENWLRGQIDSRNYCHRTVGAMKGVFNRLYHARLKIDRLTAENKALQDLREAAHTAVEILQERITRLEAENQAQAEPNGRDKRSARETLDRLFPQNRDQHLQNPVLLLCLVADKQHKLIASLTQKLTQVRKLDAKDKEIDRLTAENESWLQTAQKKNRQLDHLIKENKAQAERIAELEKAIKITFAEVENRHNGIVFEMIEQRFEQVLKGEKP